ncbi:MAG: MoaD family protein [Peptococcaceae bacterium]|jgi:molybdopterin synthase sulfur carrier subunit|nr:MoaD family protein [Peptococcaceae bacterium]
MILHLRSVLDIAQILGGKEHTVSLSEGATVCGLIDLLATKHGGPLREQILQSSEPMELIPQVKIYVNGRGIDFLEGLDTVLQDGDDIVIMPQISGG